MTGLFVTINSEMQNCLTQIQTFQKLLTHISNLISRKVSFLSNSLSSSFLEKQSHTIQFTLLKCVVQWFLVYSQNCVPSPVSNSRTFFITQKETLYPLASLLIPLFPQHLATKNLLSCSIFIYFGHSIKMQSYVIPRDWLLSLSIMFPRLICIHAYTSVCSSTSFSFMVKQYSTVWMYHICLSISQSMNTWGQFLYYQIPLPPGFLHVKVQDDFLKQF